MSDSYFSARKIRPRYRQEAVAQSITWRLHRSQRQLAEAERSVIASALMHGNTEVVSLHVWVVMNDHVPIVLTPAPGANLDKILNSWKGFTTTQWMKDPARRASIWQRGWYDRVLFSPEALASVARYVAANPWRRWPELCE